MKKICFLLLCFLMVNCATSKPSNFYNITVIKNNNFKIENNKKISIGIKQVIIPNYLSRPQIVTVKNKSEFNVSETNRWLESLQYSIQRAVADNISSYNENFTAKSINFEKDNFDYVIQIEVNRMDGNFNGFVELDSFYTIKDKYGKIETKHINLLNKISIDKIDYSKLVNEYNLLISELSKKIAEDIIY